MSQDVADRLRKHPDFIAQVRQITSVFKDADAKAVQAAIEKADFGQLCKALKVSEEWFAHFLKGAGVQAEQMFSSDTDLAEAVRRQQPKR